MSRTDSWFRLYNGAVDNPKVQRLPDALFKAWVNLLCVASRNGGRIPPPADVAFALRVKESVAQGWLAALEAHHLLDRDADGALTPHDWCTLQYKQDVSTDRVKRFRARERQAGMKQPDMQDETVSETVSETAPEQSRSEQITTDSPQTPQGVEEKEEKIDSDFEAFWAAYPEKIARVKARGAWDATHERPDVATLLAALARYAAAKPADRQWCSPARWLREGRWNDAPADPAREPLIGGRTAAHWRWGAKMFAERKYWPPSFGPGPGARGCECPAAILTEFNLQKDVRHG